MLPWCTSQQIAMGEVFAYTSEPSLVEGECVCVWKGPFGYNTGVTVSFEPGESWKDTLTCYEGDGQEWMIDLKTKIAVEYALLEANAIHGKSGASTQVAWRDESTSIANWRDSLQEVQV